MSRFVRIVALAICTASSISSNVCFKSLIATGHKGISLSTGHSMPMYGMCRIEFRGLNFWILNYSRRDVNRRASKFRYFHIK